MNPLKKVNQLIIWLEKRELIKRTPGIIYDYKDEYPYFDELESNYQTVKRECEHLLTMKDDIQDVTSIAGKKTAGGIHVVNGNPLCLNQVHSLRKTVKYVPKRQQ